MPGTFEDVEFGEQPSSSWHGQFGCPGGLPVLVDFLELHGRCGKHGGDIFLMVGTRKQHIVGKIMGTENRRPVCILTLICVYI